MHGIENTTFDDDAFMKFAPDMKKYNLPDTGGSYISRFTNDTSHIILTISLESIINYKSIYLTAILLDFMAYASQNISKLIHKGSKTTNDAGTIFNRIIINIAQKEFNKTL